MPNCFMNGLCGAGSLTKVKQAIDTPVLAPFVRVVAKGQGLLAVAQTALNIGPQSTIGVGDGSFPAIVKSLQFGMSNGVGCDIEILDQEGGDFAKIFDKISHGGASADYLVTVQWGWVGADCSGGVAIPVPSNGDPTVQPTAGMSSPIHTFVITNMTINFAAGSLKFVIHCIDMMQELYDTKVPGVSGTAKYVQTLQDALSDILKDRKVNIVFKKFNGVTQETTFEFLSDAGNVDAQKGPKGVWHGNNRSVITCVGEWCRTALEQGGKGFQYIYDSTKSPPDLVIMAMIGPVCENTFDAEPWKVATYVVNGGGCSPVISFHPNIKWSGGSAYASGGTAGAAQPQVVKSQGPAGCLANQQASPNIYKDTLIALGHTVQMVVPRINVEGYVHKAVNKAYEMMFQHNLAAMAWHPIQADLRIQGDPSLSNAVFLVGRYVELIVINPFQITAPCQWTTTSPACNSILSNKNWQIVGVFHDIREGSYTTTLKLVLPAPGQQIALSAPPGDGGTP